MILSRADESVAGFGEEPARLAPGVLLAGGIAALSLLASIYLFAGEVSPLFLAMAAGILFNNTIGTPAAAVPGLKFSLRRILRLAVMLLGLQLTIAQVVEVRWTGVAIIASALTATFLFTLWLGRVLGVERKLAELIAAGTSICGASAVIATNMVTRAPDEDVTYAVACVTVFGSIAMFLYPLLPALLSLSPGSFGLWAGSSIHEVAQVVAASFQDGETAGHMGTVAKLSRVMMLAPAVVMLSLVSARRGTAGETARKVPVPYFVLGFVALVAFNSAVVIPAAVKGWTTPGTTFLLSLSIAAMGLETDARKLHAKGLKPVLLGAGAALFISLFSLTLIKLAL